MSARMQELERRFAQYVGARDAIAVNADWAALQLALETIGLQPGDEIVVGADATPVTADAIVRVGARPMLADVSSDALTLDPHDVAGRLTERTRAIVPSHFAGQACDMDGVLALAARHALRVIEDAAHALGATYRGRRIGSVGELTVFGFGPDRVIDSEQGAVLTTDHAEHAARIRAWRDGGLAGMAGRLPTGVAPGDDATMPEAAAAIALERLDRIERLLGIRAYYATLYQHGLSDVSELLLPEARPDTQHAWDRYVVRLDLDRILLGRDTFIAALARRGVRAEAGFEPLWAYPAYRDAFTYRAEDYPRARRATESAVSLPLHSRMNEADVWNVIHVIRTVVADHRRPGNPAPGRPPVI